MCLDGAAFDFFFFFFFGGGGCSVISIIMCLYFQWPHVCQNILDTSTVVPKTSQNPVKFGLVRGGSLKRVY